MPLSHHTAVLFRGVPASGENSGFIAPPSPLHTSTVAKCDEGGGCDERGGRDEGNARTRGCVVHPGHPIAPLTNPNPSLKRDPEGPHPPTCLPSPEASREPK